MAIASAKITRKGQVTITKDIRKKLNADMVYFEVQNDTVIVRPVRDAVRSLSEYSKNVKPDASMNDMKERAWEDAVHEKTTKKPT